VKKCQKTAGRRGVIFWLTL